MDCSKIFNELSGFINKYKGQITTVIEGIFRDNEEAYNEYTEKLDSLCAGNVDNISPLVLGTFIDVLTIFTIEKKKYIGTQSFPEISGVAYKEVFDCCAIYFEKSITSVGAELYESIRGKTTLENYSERELEEDIKYLEFLIDENSEDEEVEEDNDLAEMYEDTIALTVASLMETFKLLFESCYEIAPYGILGSDGTVYSFSEKSRMVIKRKSALIKLYDLFSVGLKKGAKTPDFGNAGYDIFFGFLACVAFGKKLVPSKNDSDYYPPYVEENNGVKDTNITWGKYSKYLQKQLTILIERDLQKTLKKMSESERESTNIDALLSDRYVKRITNCCIITEYNVEVALKLIFLNNKLDGTDIANSIRDSLERKVLLQGRGEVKSVTYNKGVARLIIVFDDDLYSRVPLFAFQAVELMKKNGKRPSWRNVVLGRDTEDKLYSADFGRGDKFATSIVAGSGSGKGVMTLNILSAAIADDVPVFYLDSKPDMSITISELAAKTGHKAFAYDALSPRMNSEFTEDTFFKRANIPDYVSNVLGHSMAGYCSISYLKALQLCLLLSDLRKQVIQKKSPISGQNGTLTLEDLGGDYVAVVADEFLAACNNFYSSAILAFKNNNDVVESKKRGEDKSCLYYKALLSWDAKLSTGLADYYTQTGRISGMNTITLLQKVKSSTSNEEAEHLKIFNTYFSNQNGLVKFLGRGVSDGQQGTLYLKNTDYAKLIEEQRNWLQVEQRVMNKPEKGKKLEYPVFKAYLVVNDTDERSRCMVQLRETPGIEKVIGEYGNANPAVAFEGYIQLLASDSNNQGGIDIGEKLEKAFNIMTNLVHCMGYKGSLDDYLYDYDIDNFKTVDTLASYVKDYLKGKPVNWHDEVEDYSEYNGDDNGNGDGEGYSENGGVNGNSFSGIQEDSPNDLSQSEISSFADSMTNTMSSIAGNISQEERWREQLMEVVENIWQQIGDSLPFTKDIYMKAAEASVQAFINKKVRG